MQTGSEELESLLQRTLGFEEIHSYAEERKVINGSVQLSVFISFVENMKTRGQE